jgi:UDP-N-acetylglucosamine--N-acetylmuramyl-(pentapeptide) pyrophosphoryl-undecaprenol N-acetylglucosamine transferase
LHPGMANSFLRFFATKISVTFAQAELARSSKSVLTGHPVRPGLATSEPSAAPGPAARRLLILGGSQGAKAVDQALVELLPFLKQHQLEIQHQCRTDSLDSLTTAYQAAGIRAQVCPFIHDLNASYAWADIILSRSGAGACAEVAIVNKPTILVPYPHAQAGHQLANARIIVEAGKALLCEEGPGFGERLRQALEALLDPAQYHAMHARPRLQRGQSAAQQIAQGVLALCKERS